MRPLKSILAPALLTLSCLGVALAQPCVLGSYTDANGAGLSFKPTLFTPFSVYVVIRVENAVAGVGYSISVPENLLFTATGYGPNGQGLNVPRNGGENVGLGECALGFNGAAIVVATYQAIAMEGMPGGAIDLGPNLDLDPLWPVYANCNDQLLLCEGIEELVLSPIVANESRSFGSVKALYAQ